MRSEWRRQPRDQTPGAGRVRKLGTIDPRTDQEKQESRPEPGVRKAQVETLRTRSRYSYVELPEPQTPFGNP